jgi:hypothetical protein
VLPSSLSQVPVVRSAAVQAATSVAAQECALIGAKNSFMLVADRVAQNFPVEITELSVPS